MKISLRNMIREMSISSNVLPISPSLLVGTMPEFSGLDVIKSLKNENLLERRNIVVFTASSDPKVFEETERSGVKAIFKKPFSVDDLTALIDNFRKNN